MPIGSIDMRRRQNRKDRIEEPLRNYPDDDDYWKIVIDTDWSDDVKAESDEEYDQAAARGKGPVEPSIAYMWRHGYLDGKGRKDFFRVAT